MVPSFFFLSSFSSFSLLFQLAQCKRRLDSSPPQRVLFPCSYMKSCNRTRRFSSLAQNSSLRTGYSRDFRFAGPHKVHTHTFMCIYIIHTHTHAREALFIIGAEQFSAHTGYSRGFRFAGPHQVHTHRYIHIYRNIKNVYFHTHTHTHTHAHALFIIGAEQFSAHTGYSRVFRFVCAHKYASHTRAHTRSLSDLSSVCVSMCLEVSPMYRIQIP